MLLLATKVDSEQSMLYMSDERPAENDAVNKQTDIDNVVRKTFISVHSVLQV